MANRPGKIVYLAQDRMISAKVNTGWRDTINWVVSCLHHMKGKRGVSVGCLSTGFPTITLNIQPGKGIEFEDVGHEALRINATDEGGGDKVVEGPGIKIEPVTADDGDKQKVSLNLVSAADSNVEIKTDANGVTTIGVYYV